jgi:hypothetical protein
MTQNLNTISVRSSTLGLVRAYADSTGTVRAWDSVAGHYTIHHGLTSRQESRVRRLAANA